MTYRYTALAILVLPALLAGCAPQDVGFGDAVRHNIALQVIDPDPHYKGEAQPGGSGDQAALAAERYREGKVTQPATTGTSKLQTSASGQPGSGAPAR